MANQTGNFGFRPVQMQGGAYNGQGQNETLLGTAKPPQYIKVIPLCY